MPAGLTPPLIPVYGASTSSVPVLELQVAGREYDAEPSSSTSRSNVLRPALITVPGARHARPLWRDERAENVEVDLDLKRSCWPIRPARLPMSWNALATRRYVVLLSRRPGDRRR